MKFNEERERERDRESSVLFSSGDNFVSLLPPTFYSPPHFLFPHLFRLFSMFLFPPLPPSCSLRLWSVLAARRLKPLVSRIDCAPVTLFLILLASPLKTPAGPMGRCEKPHLV